METTGTANIGLMQTLPDRGLIARVKDLEDQAEVLRQRIARLEAEVQGGPTLHNTTNMGYAAQWQGTAGSAPR